MTRKLLVTSAYHKSAGRFNGAASAMTRKPFAGGRLVVDVVRFNGAASAMTRKRAGAHADDDWNLKLQWGRVGDDAETRRGDCGGGDLQGASMGPRRR